MALVLLCWEEELRGGASVMVECDFAQLAHKLIIIEKVKTAEDVAKDMGLIYDTLYARLNQRVSFRPTEVRALISALKDIRLASTLLDGTPFIPADRPQESDAGGNDVSHLTQSLVLQISDVLRAVMKGLEDKRLDHRDRAKILEETIEAEAMLASLRVLLEEQQGS